MSFLPECLKHEPGDFTLWIGGNSQTENKQTFTLE